MQSAELFCAVMCSSKTVKRLHFMLCERTAFLLSFLSSSHKVLVYTPGRPLTHGIPSALASRAGITGICYHTQLLSLSVLMECLYVWVCREASVCLCVSICMCACLSVCVHMCAGVRAPRSQKLTGGEEQAKKMPALLKQISQKPWRC